MTLKFPAHWVGATIGDLADVSGGLTKSASKREASQLRVPLVSVAAVRLRHIDEAAIGDIGILSSDQDRASLERGDLLIVEGNGSLEHIGRVALWDCDIRGARHQNHIIRVRPHEVSSQFLLEWLASPAGRDAIVSEATSATGLYTLSLSKVERLPAPLPPLGEQRRIVAKLNAVFEQTRAAKARLERLPALLEKLKRSILAAAFRGDLTKDWRVAHPNVEPAGVLLDRIRTARRRRWEDDMRAKGKDPKKATYGEPAAVDQTGLPDLPSGWTWAPAELVVAPGTIITYGIVLPGKHVDGGVPYVRQQDIQDGTVNVGDLLRTTPQIAAKFERSSLIEGDVLLCIIRHRRVAIVPRGMDGSNITQGTVRLRPSVCVAGPYLAAWLESPVAQRWMEGRVFGLDMPRINVGDTREIPVPVPPRAEQDRIVSLLGSIRERLDGLFATQVTASSLAERLEQAVLAKAFRGELVPQDPTDEPASILLDRIHAARAAEPAPARRGRRSPQGDPSPSQTSSKSNSTSEMAGAAPDNPFDLVVATFHAGKLRLTAADIIETTGLRAAQARTALKALVAAGQVRIELKGREPTYIWTP